MNPAGLSGWYALLYALLIAGFGKYLVDCAKFVYRWHASKKPAGVEEKQIHQQVELANQSVVTMSRSTQRLEADNERLRAEITDMDARHRAERAEWQTERTRQGDEIEQLRDEIEELETKWRAALDQVAIMREKLLEMARNAQRGIGDGTAN